MARSWLVLLALAAVCVADDQKPAKERPPRAVLTAEQKKRFAELKKSARPSGSPAVDRATLAKLRPLTELGKEKYQGFPGGLYPDGKNTRPAQHEAAGLALAKKVVPLDAAGLP